jgi:hypothetical protein
MKTKILFLLCALCASVATAQNPSTNLAAVYTPVALVYTNGYVDNANYTTPSGPLNVTRHDTLGWQISHKLSGSGTAVNYYDFECSLDNTNWPGTYFYTAALASSGTTLVQTNLEMYVGSQGYIRLGRMRVGNNSGSYPTNITLLYTPKPFQRR